MKEIPKNTPEFSIPKEELLHDIQDFHLKIVSSIRNQMSQQTIDHLSKIEFDDKEGDTVYNIDKNIEPFVDQFAQNLSQKIPLRIVAEGIGQKDYLGTKNQPEITVIIDPIDGTRGLMYDIRSAFVLTGIAPFKNGQSNLSDINLAIQTEIPTTKQNKISQLYAIKNNGAFESILNLDNTQSTPYQKVKTSNVPDINKSFSTIVNFFQGTKKEIGEISDKIFEKILGPVSEGKDPVFDDQYISNAGQIYLLATGRYRFIADLRPEFIKSLNQQNKKVGLCSHPYDLCTTLIAQEAGAIITDAQGQSLEYPLNTQTNCSWIGYANKDIQKQIQPILLQEIQKI